MKINGDIKRDSLFAGLAGVLLTLVVVSTVFLVPAMLDFINSPFFPGPEPYSLNDDSKLGSRVAKYMNARESDVLFVWCYNNTFVNYNLTAHFAQFYESTDYSFYVDGVLISGAPVGGSPVNISVIHEPAAETAATTPSGFVQVIDAFENALSGLHTTSSTITEPFDIWPPTFLWDIAFNDGSSISLIYSSVHHVMAAVNGTWSYTENYFHGVQFPQFDYTTNRDAVYFVLDEEAENSVLGAIQALYDLITGATFE